MCAMSIAASPEHSHASPLPKGRCHRPVVTGVIAGLVGAVLIAGYGAGDAGAQAIGGTKAVQIGMKSLKFTPAKATAKVAQEVTFVWKENVAHNIVFDAKCKSKTQSKGAWKTKFDKTGTFKFLCTLHPGMKGQITISK